jgi:hypothetical protein
MSLHALRVMILGASLNGCRVILEVDANVIAQRVTMRTEGSPEMSYAEHVWSPSPPFLACQLRHTSNCTA